MGAAVGVGEAVGVGVGTVVGVGVGSTTHLGCSGFRSQKSCRVAPVSPTGTAYCGATEAAARSTATNGSANSLFLILVPFEVSLTSPSRKYREPSKRSYRFLNYRIVSVV